jgi:type II secretory pathway pseudopilin PulG
VDSVNLLQRFQKKAKAPRLVPVIRRRSENGDTLIEVLVSLTVLGTASVALLVALGTVISASAEHRNLTNNDLALETAAQEITAQMQTNSSYFLTACPENLANYPYNSGSPAFTVTEGSKTIPISYGYGTNTAVQFWGTAKNTVNNPSNINTFNPNNLCQDSVPQMITIQVTGTTDVLSFVVDNTFGSTGDSAAGTAAQLVIANSPGTLYAPPNSAGTSGTVLNFQPVIEVADSNGNTVLTDLSPVQILLYPVSGSGAVSGCSGLESQGYVTFTNCTISSAGTYDICATDNSINASPTDPTFNGGVPTGSISLDGSTAFCNNAQGGVVQIIVTGGGSFLVFTVSPVGGQSGTPLTTEPTITDENSSGTPISVGTNAVTVTVTASGGQLATSTGCTTATIPANGNSVTLSGCNFSGGYQLVSQGKYQATQYVLIASATGITTGVSGAFGVSDYGFVTQVSFYTQPIGVAAGTQAVPAANTPFATQSVTIPFVTTTNAQAVVALRDAFGNVVGNGYNNSSSTQPDGITGGISAGETLGCSGAETFNSGYYIITGFCGSAYMNNVTFSAQATVSNVGVTPVKVSNPFNITYVASSLTFTTQPVLAASGTSFSTMPVVSISDWQNSPVTAATASTLNLSFTPKTPSNASLTLCTNLTPLAGVVDVENCVFGGSETTTYDLTASITVGGVTLGPVNSSGFSPTLPGAATQLVFSSATPVVAGVAGAVLTSSTWKTRGETSSTPLPR